MPHRRPNIILHKEYFIALAFSVLLWFFSAMSEERVFDNTLHIEWTGYDTARYVIAEADQSVRVSITSSGFAALSNNHTLQNESFRIAATADTVVQFSDCQRAIVSQMGLRGVRVIEARQPSLSLKLTEHASRPFVPLMSKVQFEFADGYGIYGKPVVTPDTVWLYGSEESLSEIGQLCVSATTISGITTTNTYTVDLEPVWEHYIDVRPSTTQVTIRVPTAVYSEQVMTLPIALRSADSDVRLRIYPEQAQVTLWVADQNKNHIATDMIELSVDYDRREPSSDRLSIRATEFPDFVRIKKIEPEEVRFVIIK
ncbi:MAG: hypothetical protein IJU90_05775 [Bacteroidales bacterium]|nr:hypothetical protein [Bacteroidales bacterium]